MKYVHKNYVRLDNTYTKMRNAGFVTFNDNVKLQNHTVKFQNLDGYFNGLFFICLSLMLDYCNWLFCEQNDQLEHFRSLET